MECPETMLEKLTAEVKTLEAQVTHLNIKVSEQCPDGAVQHEFTHIKEGLKGVEKQLTEALAHSAALAGKFS